MTSRPVDIASLALFRILFGLLMAVAMIRFMALGWIEEFYIRPAFHFTWAWLPWVRPWPGELMYVHVAALALLALGIAVGFHYRVCATLFCAGFTYLELIDKATYLNHYYLVSLLSGLLVVLPAHRAWSLDARRRPEIRATVVPAWTVNLLRFQIAVVYVFAGLAKLDSDWLVHAQPLRMWLAARSDLPIVGPWLEQPWTAFAFSWGGALYDLTIVWALMWSRTRAVAFATVMLFHVMTWGLFPIGMFPWIMTIAATIFFSPHWPRQWLPHAPQSTPQPVAASVPPFIVTRGLAIGLVVYAAMQIAVPLRAFAPGVDPNWTGRGFNFAWRVMLVEKAGDTQFIAVEPSTKRRWPLSTRAYITERQERMMAQDPFMIRALARRMAADLGAPGSRSLEVHVESFAAINGHPAARLIDPAVNFAEKTPPYWIVPRSQDPEPDADPYRVYLSDTALSPAPVSLRVLDRVDRAQPFQHSEDNEP